MSWGLRNPSTLREHAIKRAAAGALYAIGTHAVLQKMLAGGNITHTSWWADYVAGHAGCSTRAEPPTVHRLPATYRCGAAAASNLQCAARGQAGQLSGDSVFTWVSERCVVITTHSHRFEPTCVYVCVALQ